MNVLHSHAVRLARRALEEYQQPDDAPRHGGAGLVVVLLLLLFVLVSYGLVCDLSSLSIRGNLADRSILNSLCT